MTPLGIEVRAVGARTDIALHGELDAAGCNALRDCIDVLDRSVRTVAVDLSDLTFLDAAGVSVLLHLHDRLSVQLRRLDVVAVRGPARRVLELTGASAALGLQQTSGAAPR